MAYFFTRAKTLKILATAPSGGAFAVGVVAEAPEASHLGKIG
jgi:hypothetical protein